MPVLISIIRRTYSALLLASIVAFARPALAADLTAMTLNTKHGGQAPWRTTDQIDEIVKQHPDVVLLQEAEMSQLDDYVNGINRGLQSTAWHGEYARHCQNGKAPDCSSPTGEAVMILSRLPFTDVEKRLIWAGDEYFVARGVLRVAIRLDSGATVQVFACHLPASEQARDARLAWVDEFLPWARSFSGPRLVGGDFNDDPGSSPIAALRREYIDAWRSKGSGNGGTHSHDDQHYVTRIDYLWSARGLVPVSAFVPQVALSDHRPVVASFVTDQRAATDDDSPAAAPAPVPAPVIAPPVLMPPSAIPPTAAPGTPAPSPTTVPTPSPAIVSAPSASGESVLLEDTFDAGVIDRTKWPSGVCSGYEDLRLPLTASGGGLEIVPLTDMDGISRYNGICSAAYDLTNGGYASVQLVHGPTGAAAYAMFTVGADPMNFYRIYQGGPADARVLLMQKKIDGIKAPLVAVPYDPLAHQVLRVRRDHRAADSVDDVVFETSTTAGPAAAFVELFREPWDPAIDPAALTFEMKAGTSAPEPQPGSAVWDNFRAATFSEP